MRTLIGVLGLLCVAVVAVGCARSESRLYTSPDGRYDVQLQGAFGPTDSMLFLSKVGATVRDKRSSAATDLGTIYDFDAFDTPFDKMYGHHEWMNPRLLRFSGSTRPLRDRLTIVNTTGERLPAVFCNVGDFLFVLDVESGARIDTSVSGTRNAGALFVHARARLRDGVLLSRSEDLTALRPDAVIHYQVVLERTSILLNAYFENP